MKRLLLLPLLLTASLSSCTLPSLLSGGAAVLPADPLGATLTATQGPNYTTLEYLPGKALTRQTVAHLVGPELRVNDSRCVVEKAGLACAFGTVLANERRVIYVSGLSSSSLTAVREDGTPVHISGR